MATLKVPVTKEDQIQGDLKAPIVLVEYGDYECPHCGRAYYVIKKIQKYFGKRLCFVFRNFPLNELHPDAEIAAESAEFAATKNLFWPMHDLIFENQEDLSMQLLLELADNLKLPVRELEIALQNQVFAPKVKKEFIGGVRSGVNGTPTFFINGQRYNGMYDFESLVQAMDIALV